MSFFRRKKDKKEKPPVEDEPKKPEKSLLKELCKGDTELFSVLSRTVLIDPTRLAEEGIESHVKKGQEYEKKKDFLRARVNYHAAGKIALYEGKLAQVQRFFKKCAALESNPEYRNIFEYLSNKETAGKALKTAREYYTETLKLTEEKKTPTVS